MDVILFREFLQWMDERSVSHDQPFLARIYQEDVAPCLNFPNKEVKVGIVHVVILGSNKSWKSAWLLNLRKSDSD